MSRKPMLNLIQTRSDFINHDYNYTRCVGNFFPVFSLKKTHYSQQWIVKIYLFKVLAIGFYTFCPYIRQFIHAIPKELFLL